MTERQREGKMRKILFIITIICMVGIFTQAVWADQPKGPEIFFENTIFDAKRVEEGSNVEHTFTVSNRGDQPLKIIKVKPG